MKVFTLSAICVLGVALLPSQAASSKTTPAAQDVNRILAEERLVATVANGMRLTPTNFAARLVVELPTSLASENLNGMAVTAFSLASFAADPSLLEEAWISFDSKQQHWKAMWPKPPMFHFGMVLFPALVKKLSAGQTLTFESRGTTAILSKDKEGHLQVKRDGVLSQVTASDLRDLLRNGIVANGLSLCIDNAGNLILQASGQQALALASQSKK